MILVVAPHSPRLLADRRAESRDRPGSISPSGVLPNPRALLLRTSLSHSLSLSHFLTRSLSLRSLRPARETELHAYNPSARPSVRPSFLPPYVCPSRRCITRPTKTTMRLLLPPRPAIRRDATTSTYMIKPLSVRFSRVSLSSLSATSRSPSLSPSLAHFRGRKARYAEIARSKSTVESPRNERASSSRVPSDSVANSLLAPCHFSFLLPPTPPSPPSPPPPYDGGFQRDVLVAANSMCDESSMDSSRTVTDTAARRSIAG